MMVLLRWLVEHTWVLYAACGIGVIVYAVSALSAHRERGSAQFTLERDAASVRIVRAWIMILVFIGMGAIVFVGTTSVLPGLPFYDQMTSPPTPTLAAGVEPLTPGITLTVSPTAGFPVPTLSPLTTTVPVATLPRPELTETPTAAPTDTPAAAISGEVHVRFGGFAELSAYALPATEITTAQPLPLTLYWQALEGTSPVDYVVFTHLLAEDGSLVAQHDGPPVNGARPTTGWVPGETIVDPHQMAFSDTSYIGPAGIAVGLYDPDTGRVLAETGEEFVILPITISIVQ